jgi:hypothetical protein
MSALPPKADILQHDRDVRFVPEADVCKDKPRRLGLLEYEARSHRRVDHLIA